MTKETTNGKVIRLNNGEFDTEVLKSSVPVLVDFYADWCGPCHAIAPTIEALSNEFAGKVKFVKVDVDANQEVASRYEIMSIPTIMLFENGSVEDSIVGAYPASVYKQHIERALGQVR
ncbi:thioredoxin [archaeon 13_1_40CM_2_52_13]|nr:MAG: thioredoxin [archaeon 13_1_40CM_2_52_13]OLE69791.1 MAG: thioredoxin [archaeon 13_1_20CM_2_51_12]TMI39988.1 MAG: thioredoxin [Candidatus Bathyarchaeota archaeon]